MHHMLPIHDLVSCFMFIGLSNSDFGPFAAQSWRFGSQKYITQEHQIQVSYPKLFSLSRHVVGSSGVRPCHFRQVPSLFCWCINEVAFFLSRLSLVDQEMSVLKTDL